MELNWVGEVGVGCPATESVRLLAESGYRFASQGDCDKWQDAGSWLHGLPDIVVRRFAAA
jgi:hypothetical protein